MRGGLLAVALLAMLLPGCATKRDIRDLQLQVDSLRMSQQTMLRVIEQQNRALVDSVAAHNLRLRGDVLNQLLRMDQQLVQIQELTGQGQQRLNELREQIRTREEALQSRTASATGEGARELYDAALASMQRGSHATARAGFEELIRTFPADPRAADAQLQIGESHAAANDPTRAVEAFARVVEVYPTAPAAATALFRQAEVELRRNNRTRARTLFNQVVQQYPNSPEAPRARTEAQRIR